MKTRFHPRLGASMAVEPGAKKLGTHTRPMAVGAAATLHGQAAEIALFATAPSHAAGGFLGT